MSWFLGVACFLLAPSLELANSFPFLLGAIDLVDLVWVFGEGDVLARFCGGKVGLVMALLFK